MKKPETPLNEEERLRSLRDYEILDTAPEIAFDALTKLAAHIAGVPIALVSLVDTDRQWFKARYGLDAPETPRDVSFCGHVVAAEAPLMVPDAFQDERFFDNPLVTGEPRVRFYAGFPLRTPDGFVLGTLCAIDHEAREISAKQREMLALLAQQVVDQLELRRRSRRLETHGRFFEMSLTLLCTADDKMYFRELNPAWQRTLGWTLDELRAKPFLEFIHPDDLASTLAVAGRLLEGAITVDFQNRYRHKDGRWVPLAWNAAAKGGVFYAAAVDLSEILRTERELRQFKKTLDSTKDAILIFDPTSLRISYANQGAVDHSGYSVDELLEETPLDLKPLFDEPRYRQLLEPLVTGQSEVATFETLHRHKAGHDIPVEVVLQYMAPAGDEPRFINIVRDISERKRLEKLKSEFVSTVSHELRTPLTSIRGSLGLVAGGITGELPKEAKEYVDIALSNSDRLVRLINDILDIEKMQSGSMEFRMRAIELAGAVRSSIAANDAFAASHGVRLVLAEPVPTGEVLVDPDRFAQVLTNLVSNAAKFSPKNGVVEVNVHVIDDRVRVSVRDHGPGIPEEFRGRIFQRFAQADASSTRQKGGTGLGLSISKAIVEQMHGSIGFDAADGGGTVFFFDLPFLPPVVGANASAGSALRVLVCEDDPDVSRVRRRS